MNRLIDEIVLVGLVTACLFAGSPTLISPPSTNPITEGVVLFPSALGITTGSLPSITETHEFVVPKSIPIILLIILFFLIRTIPVPLKISDTLAVIIFFYLFIFTIYHQLWFTRELLQEHYWK